MLYSLSNSTHSADYRSAPSPTAHQASNPMQQGYQQVCQSNDAANTQLDQIQEGLNDHFPRIDAAGSDFYPIASDTHFEDSLNYCEQVTPVAKTSPTTDRVGLLVGDSFLLSALPSFKKHVDNVIVADYNPRMLDMIRFKLDAIRQSPTREDYLKRLISTDNPHLNLFPKPYRGNMDDEGYQAIRAKAYESCLAKKLPQSSFLLSDEHYAQARQTALETPIRFACVNLFNLEESGKLGRFISEKLGDITVLNATNLFDYRVDQDLRHTPKSKLIQQSTERTNNFISPLPFNANPLVLYSIFVKYGRSNASQPGCGSFVARSPNKYMKANLSAAEKW